MATDRNPNIRCVFLASMVSIIVLEEDGKWKYPTQVMLAPGPNGTVTCQFPQAPLLLLAANKMAMPNLTGTAAVAFVTDPDPNVEEAYRKGYLPSIRMAASGLIPPSAMGGIIGGARRQ